MTAIEPVVGVEFLANKKVRLALSAKYSWQVISVSDLDFDDPGIPPLDVDIGGFYSSISLSFMLGKN